MKNILVDKTILVTGATDGLGKLLVLRLAEKGARVLLHGRCMEKGLSVLEEIKKITGNQHLNYYNADFSSLEAVHAMSEKIVNEQPRIDILINNAGMGTFRREISRDGMELTMAVNYMAQVLLTEKLLPVMATGSGKVINVASASQEQLNFSDFMMERYYEGYSAYCKSKTSLIMYTIDLAERLIEAGIAVNALHPATLMNTKMVPKNSVCSSVEEGATAVEALLKVETTGKYFNGKRQAKAIHQVYDAESRKELRELTQRMLKPYLYAIS
ncbi:SDR family NAD(P)-dependent oxidoreductase [Chitinophaga pendula]|uniref:SDR family NAD(P)-dependent oxidoreductase n=1 Tax=Chitinophaga TaxID=79328 RepID=UPI000BAEFD78|nr:MULTISPECIES: SDR family NAD(P)-dependent oxidoreductase [Chitinophaga]ASZ14472.1 oxidoreductase [Chitinophaga sp. MD30]UCJ07871.1 SDR family NAD(P)-dependent oxidoreductase [Chitinophaga pendula]